MRNGQITQVAPQNPYIKKLCLKLKNIGLYSFLGPTREAQLHLKI